MYCRKCGEKINDEQQVCLKCGTILTKNVNNNFTNVRTNQKSKITAGILGILLGTFGIHNFYLGYYGKAVAQLLITILSCFILSTISGLWGFIEGIMILTGNIAVDGNGIPLDDKAL